MRLVSFVLWVFLASCSHTYYVVRHAERATAAPNMSSDVPLSDEGKQRAENLKNLLHTKKVSEIFSTNTLRTRSTVQPTADYFQLKTQLYGPRPDSAFIQSLKTKKKNVLVVGHSNTVDDIVNMLCGNQQVPGDLAETEYDNLFIVTKKGKKWTITRKKYGYPSNPEK